MAKSSRTRQTLIKAARMYYLDGMSQREVASTLCTTPSNVSRMLTMARKMGIVRIRVEDTVPRNHDLEREFAARFGLSEVRILAAPAGDPEEIEGVGMLAAEYLTDHLHEGQRIALSWGTSLQATVAAVEVDRGYNSEVLQLVGGMTGSASYVTGEELVRELAGRLGCEYRYLHAPAVFSSAATRNAVRAEPAVEAALAIARQADIALVGIGAAGQGSSATILDEMDLSPAELAELDAASPVGDICGYFYDITGRECLGALHDRVLAIELAELQRIPTVVGVAAGAGKARGLLGALNGRYLDVVACDQTLAERVLALDRFGHPASPDLDRSPRRPARRNVMTAVPAAAPATEPTAGPPGQGLATEPGPAREVLTTMRTIRHFEEAVDQLFARGLLYGTMHLSIGQEAVPAGVCRNLRTSDKITSTHRGHGHCISKGADLTRMMAELLGRDAGYCRGRGGSMHIADLAEGNLGANGIVAGGIPIAVGAALTQQLTGTDGVVVSFFGDGALNEGDFHEAANMAAIWDLPVVFVCENNHYGMSMPVSSAFRLEHLADRAAGYGIVGVTVDGNDVEAVHRAAATAVDRARAGGGPTLLECVTYRHKGHSKSDRNVYRTRDEIALWQSRDPITFFEAAVAAAGTLGPDEIRGIEEATGQAVRDAVLAARKSPEASADDLEKEVYAS